MRLAGLSGASGYRGLTVIPNDVFQLYPRVVLSLQTNTNQRLQMKLLKKISFLSLLPLSAFG